MLQESTMNSTELDVQSKGDTPAPIRPTIQIADTELALSSQLGLNDVTSGAEQTPLPEAVATLPVDAHTDHSLPERGSAPPMCRVVALAPSQATGAAAEHEVRCQSGISTAGNRESATFIQKIAKPAPPSLMKTLARKPTSRLAP
jgi:hypothetical protein